MMMVQLRRNGCVQNNYGNNYNKLMKRRRRRRLKTRTYRSSPSSSPPSSSPPSSSPPRAVARRRKRRVVQDLYECCLDVFKGVGTVPSEEDVHKLRNIIDNMKPEDVGLTKDLPFFQNNCTTKGTPRVTNTTIYQSNNFSLCIFFLPANAVVPLHNHPGMTVFIKLLWGTMHIKSYDWVNPSTSDDTAPQPNNSRLARLETNSVFTAPCNTSVLYPTTGGNIHAFTAITPCAVLDVMGPPYSQEDGRDCSYYKDFPFASFPYIEIEEKAAEEGEVYGWLEEIEPPEDSKMDVIKYLGPQVHET